MADERKFALPDSMQFRAFYAQKRRRSRNSIVAPITRTFIDLDPIANAYYEIASPIAFTGDFEIEVDFASNTVARQMILAGTIDTIEVNGASQLEYSIGGATRVVALTTPFDGKLHNIKITRVAPNEFLSYDGVQISTSPINTNSAGGLSRVGSTIAASNFFEGIIANAKFTDKSGASDVVTTFRLDNSPAAENYTYSTELLDNNTFPDNANARQYLVSSKGWIITDGGAA